MYVDYLCRGLGNDMPELFLASLHPWTGGGETIHLVCPYAVCEFRLQRLVCQHIIREVLCVERKQVVKQGLPY